jgi:very-short-patch-repair endonuclease
MKTNMNWEQLKDSFNEMYKRGIPLIMSGMEYKSKSPIENIAALAIWTLNEEYGSKNIVVVRQQKIGRYTVDFEITHKPFFFKKEDEPMLKIVIECDGHEWHEKTKEQVSRDKERDRELQKLGYVVLRYSGSDLYKNWRTVRDDVYDLIDPNEKKEIDAWYKETYGNEGA